MADIDPATDGPDSAAPESNGQSTPPTDPLADTPHGLRTTSRMAVASLILGILGLLLGIVLIGIPLALVGLILGVVALTQIANRPHELSGRGMAMTGVILSGVAMTCLVVAPLLIGILLPAMSAARWAARQMQSNTQCRGIHQSMVSFAQGNNLYFPGVNGAAMRANTAGLLFIPNGATIEERYRLLLDGNYFTGEYIISPAEIKTQWLSGPVTPANYSFVMLEIDQTSQRQNEWRDTLNTLAPVLGDRNLDTANPQQAYSIHTNTPGDWRGSVAWNDNHAGFETAPRLQTRLGPGPNQRDDHLFIPAGTADAYWIDTGR